MPPVDERGRGQVGAQPITGEHDRPADADAPAGTYRDVDTRQRPTVVHTTAARLRHAVGPHHVRRHRERKCCTTNENRVVRRQVHTGVEQPAQLGRDQRGVATLTGVEPGRRSHERLGGEPGREVEDDRCHATDERAHEHLHTGDVGHRHGEQPLTGAAEPVERGPRGVQQRRCGQQRALRRPRRP
jgi:hypothetical protein